MERTTLKKLRLLAGKTQKEIASAVGTSQPNYQRWESGKSSVPKSKVNKLAKILGAKQQEILGEPLMFDYANLDPGIPDHRTYFGTVAFHFVGPGSPLLLPISEEDRTKIHSNFDSDKSFFSISTFDNRVVFVRREALADIYFTSDNCGIDPGPEKYNDYYGTDPDDDFWLAIEHIGKSNGEYYIEYYPDALEEEYVDKVFKRIVSSEKALNALVADGRIKLSEIANIKKNDDELLDALIHKARHVTWQLCNGKVRHHNIDEPDALLSIPSLTWNDDDTALDIEFEGYYRNVLLNKDAIDYISVPGHTYRSVLIKERETLFDH